MREDQFKSLHEFKTENKKKIVEKVITVTQLANHDNAQKKYKLQGNGQYMKFKDEEIRSFINKKAKIENNNYIKQ